MFYFKEGQERIAALRRLIRCFYCSIETDEDDRFIKHLRVHLLESEKDFISDYKQVGMPDESSEIRPVGMPDVFLPLDVKGDQYARRVITLTSQDLFGRRTKQYVASIYSKQKGVGVENGIVITLYERESSYNGVLHVNKKELKKFCKLLGAGDILDRLVKTREMIENYPDDAMTRAFEMLTDKGKLIIQMRKVTEELLSLILDDVRVRQDAQEKTVPFLLSAKTPSK